MEARKRRDYYRKLLSKGINVSEHVRSLRAERRAKDALRKAETRSTLDHDGSLTIRLGRRLVLLNPAETSELRVFLDATREVASGR